MAGSIIGLFGDVPPIEFEQAYYRQREAHSAVEWLTQNSLRRSLGGSVDCRQKTHVIELAHGNGQRSGMKRMWKF